MVFQPLIVKQQESESRIDIVWDVYRKDSLKSATREKRGSGTQGISVHSYSFKPAKFLTRRR